MENHVHVVAVPLTKIALARAFGTTHKIYTKIINEREKWSGFLWQGRFFSEPLEDEHFAASMRYIELNPVRAKIVELAWEYPWSSAKAHVFGSTDSLLSDCFYIQEIKDWRLFLEE